MSQGLGNQFDKAQAAHDAQQPPEDHSCEEDGHVWALRRVAVINGEHIREYRCCFCGETTIDL